MLMRQPITRNMGRQLRVARLASYDATSKHRLEQPLAGNCTTTTWNYENQPTQYQLPSGGRVTMLYNGDNRRVKKQEP